ncbi:RHS repeat-associated core domain-containing protein [Salana multivorans]
MWVGDHGFLDKPTDTTGLTQIGARYYDPVLGAFISPDPILDTATPQQRGPYAYSENNPTTYSDPTGLISNIVMHDGGPVGTNKRGRGSASSPILPSYLTKPFAAVLARQVAPRADQQSYLAKPTAGIGSSQIRGAKPLQSGTPAPTSIVPSWLHTTLDAGGLLFPPVDIVNAIAYAIDGDWGNAGISMAGFIPIAGDAAVVGQLGYKGLRAATNGADNVANGVRLRAQLTGQEISGGHAFQKHVIDKAEFPGITTRSQFAQHIEDVVSNAVMRPLERGRTAYWQNGTVVIRNPNAVDGGTAFRPKNGYGYLLGLASIFHRSGEWVSLASLPGSWA